MEPQPTSKSAPPIARWQSALAGLSLALVTALVAAPVGLFLLLLWVIMLAAAAAHTLEKAGVLTEASFTRSLLLAAIATGLMAILSVGMRVPRLFRRTATPRVSTSPVQPGRWLATHPWSALGILLVVIDVIIVPLHQSRIVDSDPVLVGAPVAASGIWLAGSFLYGLARGWALVLEVVWSGVRRSSFFAGIVVVGSLAVTLSAAVLWSGLSRGGYSGVAPAPGARLANCGSSMMECSRVALTDIASPTSPSPASAATVTDPSPLTAAPVTPLSAPVSAPEQPSFFQKCVDELHRSGPGFESARDVGLRTARQILGYSADAEDIVHGMMVSVCLGAERISDVRPYFLKSVANATKRQKKVSSRTWCPLDPADPPPTVNQCIWASIYQGEVQEEMEAAAWQALCELDAQDRRILEMRFWQNLSHAEVASQLGISESAARKRYSRALDMLRARFKGRCD